MAAGNSVGAVGVYRPGEGEPMRTLHFGLRVADLGRSLAFYTAVDYKVVGSVPGTPLGHLTMLKLPGDEFVTIELVHDPTQGEATSGTGLSHFVIKVESLDATSASLRPRASAPRRPHHRTIQASSEQHDPDGNRIELVQWPAGHADGITAADWPE
jgi:lactoylglutathione lyase